MADLLWIYTHRFARDPLKFTLQKTARIRIWRADLWYPRWAGRSGKLTGGYGICVFTSENLRKEGCHTSGIWGSPTDNRILREIIPSLASLSKCCQCGNSNPRYNQRKPQTSPSRPGPGGRGQIVLNRRDGQGGSLFFLSGGGGRVPSCARTGPYPPPVRQNQNHPLPSETPCELPLFTMQ